VGTSTPTRPRRTGKTMRLSTCAVAALALASLCGVARAELSLPADGGAAASVPMAVLSDADVSLYRQIFADIRSGRFSDADDLYARVSDKTLEGYVLAERYLSPYGHANLSDLTEWLRTYPELPIADRVYRLAVSRASHVVHKRHHKTV